MTLLEKQVNYTLQESVKDALRNYFVNVGNERPVDFYAVVLEEIERPLLEVLGKYARHNQVKMTKILGISRGTLRKKMKQYGFID